MIDTGSGFAALASATYNNDDVIMSHNSSARSLILFSVLDIFLSLLILILASSSPPLSSCSFLKLFCSPCSLLYLSYISIGSFRSSRKFDRAMHRTLEGTYRSSSADKCCTYSHTFHSSKSDKRCLEEEERKNRRVRGGDSLVTH